MSAEYLPPHPTPISVFVYKELSHTPLVANFFLAHLMAGGHLLPFLLP